MFRGKKKEKKWMKRLLAKCSAGFCAAVRGLLPRASASHNAAQGLGYLWEIAKEISKGIAGTAGALIVASVPACLGFGTWSAVAAAAQCLRRAMLGSLPAARSEGEFLPGYPNDVLERCVARRDPM